MAQVLAEMGGAGCWVGRQKAMKYSSDVFGKVMLRAPREEAIYPFAQPTGTQAA